MTAVMLFILSRMVDPARLLITLCAVSWRRRIANNFYSINIIKPWRDSIPPAISTRRLHRGICSCKKELWILFCGRLVLTSQRMLKEGREQILPSMLGFRPISSW